MGSEPADFVSFLDAASQSGVIEGMAPPLRIALMLGAMAFLSAALVSLTAFTRVIIVLSFVKRSLTTQEIPPNTVIIGLSLFLTAFVMGPTLDSIQQKALTPFLNETMSGVEALRVASQELHQFMIYQTRQTDLAVMVNISNSEYPATATETPMRILIPAFMISELKTGFVMGFCIYITFLLIDFGKLFFWPPRSFASSSFSIVGSICIEAVVLLIKL